MIFHKDNFIVTLNNRKIFVQGRRLRGSPDQLIFKEQSPSWLPPHEKESITENEYEYILAAVLKFRRDTKKTRSYRKLVLSEG